MTVVFSGEVHPAAELFPLMSDEELDALAADILANGLRQPLVLDGEGRLLDGRNRLAACGRAGVTPDYTVADTADPVALLVSLNVKRRNLSASQRAIAAAEAWELVSPKNGGKQGRAGALSDLFGIAHGYVQQARALDPELAAEVKQGLRSLADAYAEHQRRVDAARRTESLPDDLASRVRDNGMSLDEAESVEAERRERVAAWVNAVRDALSVLSRMAGYPIPDEFRQALTADEHAALAAVLDVIPKGVGE